MLEPMVGIGVNEETYAQPQDANIYISARYMPHKNWPRDLGFYYKTIKPSE